MGLFSSCPAKQSADYTVVDVSASTDDLSQECQLSEHLINFDQHQIMDFALIMQIIALAIILWLLTSTGSLSSATEPILHKGRRIHLKLCVFRE
ncbi:copper resistance protein [Vibrio sp. LaRot3]|uniref:copper resistance protein n=1 Tax=Vibrio sp. LaRot3 TaxID=2998829 RepID=UPI0022CE30A4|nr:copper resistance protein [Vibrio sp. LaRot3]MDA0147114.1 copper resistance protein [Vibrio sp. LaRot3]